MIPRTFVSAGMEGAGARAARGVAANISEGGACICLNGSFQVGDEVIVQLAFPRSSGDLPATGRVVWVRPGRLDVRRYGVTWTHRGPRRVQLGRLIEAAA